MEYTVSLFTDFLNDLYVFNISCKNILLNYETVKKDYILEAEQVIIASLNSHKKHLNTIHMEYGLSVSTLEGNLKKINSDAENSPDYQTISNDLIEVYEQIAQNNVLFDKLKEFEQNIYEDKISSQAELNNLKKKIEKSQLELSDNIVDLSNLLAETEANLISQSNIVTKKKRAVKTCITNVNSVIQKSDDYIMQSSETMHNVIAATYKKLQQELEQLQKEKDASLTKQTTEFLKKYPPTKFKELLCNYLENTIDLKNYNCADVSPEYIFMGYFSHAISSLSLCENVKNMLLENFFFMIKYPYDKEKATLKMPYKIHFDQSFNLWVSELNSINRPHVINWLISLTMNLILALPPNRVNFTFVDPSGLGDTFATFGSFADANGINRIINNKIWTIPSEIENRLKVITEHIENINTRCLQGKYKNINEYNMQAGRNAESYYVLVLMDFPVGLTENGLRYLESIVSSGPKCGVHTIVIHDSKQTAKTEPSGQLKLVDGLSKYFMKIGFESNEIVFKDYKFANRSISWYFPNIFSQDEISNIVPKIKQRIEDSQHIKVDFDEISPEQSMWFTHDNTTELSLPIGVYGAGDTQNLVLGQTNTHALIIGKTGSGKSTLLHTLIMSAIAKYSAEQLQIYLIDMKRGVEFQVYANYKLNNFRVIAIESEQAFGYSVLKHLDEEQRKRADIFRQCNASSISEYRNNTSKTMPRILVIVDEFHMLFANNVPSESGINYSKKNAEYLETLIRQGRAFGIHVVLASQNMPTSGINNDIWGQVGIRIAFHCQEGDAHKVLSSNNNGIAQLVDRPGQIIYNPQLGNKDYNTIVQVAYIKPESQKNNLEFISKNQPKEYMGETRVMISSVDKNYFHPFQMFARDGNNVFVDNRILIGEPMNIQNNLNIRFSNNENSNLLVIGKNITRARTIFALSILSSILHNKYTSNKKKIFILDYAPPSDEDERNILYEIASHLPDFVNYSTFKTSTDGLDKIHKEFQKIKSGQEPQMDIYLYVFGLQRARNLRNNNMYSNEITFDPFSSQNEFTKISQPSDIFEELIVNGCEYGVHTAVWEDSFQMFRTTHAKLLNNFDMRLALNMPKEDSMYFIDYDAGDQIPDNQAIYNNLGDENRVIRLYDEPTKQWVEDICEKIPE